MFVGKGGNVTRLQVGSTNQVLVAAGARVLNTYTKQPQQLFVTNDTAITRYDAETLRFNVTTKLNSFCSSNGVLTVVTDGKSTITLDRSGNVCVNDYLNGTEIV